MTPAEIRALALHAAVDYAVAQPGALTITKVATAYNFFYNLINIAQLRDATQVYPVQLPYVPPSRTVADPSQYTANVNGG